MKYVYMYTLIHYCVPIAFRMMLTTVIETIPLGTRENGQAPKGAGRVVGRAACRAGCMGSRTIGCSGTSPAHVPGRVRRARRRSGGGPPGDDAARALSAVFGRDGVAVGDRF